MAAIEDRTRHSHRAGEARDTGVPLTGRTVGLFAGMVLTGTVTIGLITSAVASLLVPDNQIGVRPYLVSSLPAIMMLFLAIVPGLWCAWFWRQVFPPAERPKRRALPRRRRVTGKGGVGSRERPVVPRAQARAVTPPSEVAERAAADLRRRREERARQLERRRAEEERRAEERRRAQAEERRRAEQRRREEERRQAEEGERRAAQRRAREHEHREERRRAAERRRQEAWRRPGQPATTAREATHAPASAPLPPAPPRATPLERLRLPRRVHTTLARAGIETIEQLTSRTQAQVLEIRGVGAKSLEDILAALDRAGRALRYPDRVTRVG